MRDLELTIAGHFRDQNERQAAMNNALSEKVQRLTVGIERLVEEMNGVRTGKRALPTNPCWQIPRHNSDLLNIASDRSTSH